MADTGRDAAQAYIDALAEPRRSQIQHLHDVIVAAIPTADLRVWDYAGGLIGYGTYRYSTSKGPAGDWFAIGLASRKAYISLYSMGTRGRGYLVEAMGDRFPGTRHGKSCLNITRPESVDDDAVTELAVETWEQFRGLAHDR